MVRLLLVLLLLVSSASAQRRLLVSGSVATVDVSDFGADPTGVVSSVAAFRAALLAASPDSDNTTLTHWGKQATVYVPNGVYLLDGTVTIWNYETLLADHGTFYKVKNGFAGPVFKFGKDGTTSVKSWLIGGWIFEEGTPQRLWTAVEIKKNGGTNVVAQQNHIKEMFISDAKIGLNLEASSDAWVNATNVSECWFNSCQKILQLKTTPIRQADQFPAVDGTQFIGCHFQTVSGVTDTAIQLTGWHTVFMACQFWDANETMHIVADEQARYCRWYGGLQGSTGKPLTEIFEDRGLYNVWDRQEYP